MNPIRQFFIAVLGFLASSSIFAQDIEDYKAFKDVGIYDASISNAAANAMIEAGIVSENPEIVDLSLRALREFAVFKVSEFPHPADPLPDRTFSKVEGLKLMLIERYAQELEQAGFNSMEASKASDEAVKERMDAHPELMSEMFPERELSFAEGFHSYYRFTDDLSPVWTTFPKILCAFWPGDEEVHEFVWEMHAVDRSPGIAVTTLARLNTCRFTTYEANSFRMSQLKLAQSSDRPEASATAMIVSDGLALSNPPEALSLLIEAGMEWPEARDKVFGALSGYSDKQLDAHADALGSLMGDTSERLPYEPEVSQVIDRLRSRYE